MKKLVLHDFHKSCGANFITVKNHTIPGDYGKLPQELSFVKKKVALLDRSYLGKVSIKGADGLDLINRISTNDMSQLIMGSVCDTVFTTPKGRIIDYCRVMRYENELIMISSYIDCHHIIDWVNRFVILEDVQPVDVSDQYLWLTLIGPESTRFVRGICGQTSLEENDEHVWLEKDGVHFAALLNRNFMYPSYNFCLPVKGSTEIVSWLKGEVEKYGGGIIGDKAFQVVRVESGMPDWGTELTEDYNPHEARLLNAVSFTKGCYTGQEVIARLDTYEKVQKYLMIIDLSETISQKPPLNIYHDDEQIGKLTSYIYDPISVRSVGLGYIKKMYTVADFNTQVKVDLGGRKIRANLRIPPDNSASGGRI